MLQAISKPVSKLTEARMVSGGRRVLLRVRFGLWGFCLSRLLRFARNDGMGERNDGRGERNDGRVERNDGRGKAL